MAVRWREFDVAVRFRDRVIGGIPVVPEGADRADAYEAWARGQKVENDPSFEKPLSETLASDPEMPVTAEDVEGLLTSFKRDGEGIYVEARQVKASIRETAQRLGLIKAVKGMRQVVQHDIHVRAREYATPKDMQKIRFYDDDGNAKVDPDGRIERPISVVTRQGPRTAIKRADYVEEPTIRFRVKILAGGIGDGLMTPAALADTFELGQEVGLGADRSQGEGTFDVVEFRALDDEQKDATGESA
jgi:hypothetical protein